MQEGRNWQPLKASKEAQEHTTAAGTQQNGEGAAAASDVDAGGPPEAYDGKVNKDIDHRVYLPAAWRVCCFHPLLDTQMLVL